MSVEIKLPVSSILSNTKSIISACEDLEMQPSNIETLDTILLTQLAALVHLQEYTHARHLWRRYSSLSSTRTQSNPTLPQFTRLWRALEPLLRAHAQDTTTSSKEVYQNSNSKDNYIEAVEPSKIDIDAGDIPMVNIHKSLQTCSDEVGNDAAFQLLARFIKELQVSIRDMIAIAVERVYESIREERCGPLLGFSMGDGSSNSVDAYLKGRNWTREETGLWIPYFDPTSACHGGKEKKGAGDRIEYLTQVIGFMETQRFNA
jgi:hypothetical protein